MASIRDNIAESASWTFLQQEMKKVAAVTLEFEDMQSASRTNAADIP